MELQIILKINQISGEMDKFFARFVHEFEKSIISTKENPLLMFFEYGPREGYSTVFKSVGYIDCALFVQVEFVIAGEIIEVSLGNNFEALDGKLSPSYLNGNHSIYQRLLAQYVEAAIRKALRDISEA